LIWIKALIFLQREWPLSTTRLGYSPSPRLQPSVGFITFPGTFIADDLQRSGVDIRL